MLHLQIFGDFETQVLINDGQAAENDCVQLAVATEKWFKLCIDKKTIADVDVLQI